MPYVSGTIRKGETITYQCDKEGCKRVGQVKLVTQRIPPKGIQCRPCAKASGHTVATGYVLLATPAERDAGRKKGRETRTDQAVARRRAEAEAAAKDAPTQDQLDEEYDRLTAQIKRRKWALGMWFIFGIALGGRLCLCNCGIVKNLGRWPVVTGMTVCYLLGPVYLMTGMTFWIPRVAICRAVHTMRAVDHYFPGQRNRRQFVVVKALKAIREWRKGEQKINWNRNICNIDSKMAKKFDSENSTIFEDRVSLLRHLTVDRTLGAAAPRIELDWASVVLSPSALSRGYLLCAVPLKMDGRKTVLQVLCAKRQGCGDLLEATSADYDTFNSMMRKGRIKEILATGKDVDDRILVGRVESYERTFARGFRRVNDAIVAANGGVAPEPRAWARRLNAIRSRPVGVVPEKGASEGDVTKAGAVLMEAARRLGGAIGSGPIAPIAAGADDDEDEDMQEAPPAAQEESEEEDSEDDMPVSQLQARQAAADDAVDDDDDAADDEDDEDDDDDDDDGGGDGDESEDGDGACCKDIEVLGGGNAEDDDDDSDDEFPFRLGAMLGQGGLEGICLGDADDEDEDGDAEGEASDEDEHRFHILDPDSSDDDDGCPFDMEGMLSQDVLERLFV